MNKNLALITIFFVSHSTLQANSSSYIPMASYYIEETQKNVVAFYTAQGDLLDRIRKRDLPLSPHSYLDSRAPNPEPTTFAIKYDDECYCGEYCIVFYDRHGNSIDKYPVPKRISLHLYIGYMTNMEHFYGCPVLSLANNLDMSKIFSQTYEHTYDAFRNNYMLRVYGRQNVIANRSNFFDFLDPFLTEAENTLVLPKYFINHSHLELCSDYYTCLLHYSMAHNKPLFSSYRPDTRTERNEERLEENLKDIIQSVKYTASLDELDVEEELAGTLKLLAKAKNASFFTVNSNSIDRRN